ncbi:MAG: hypothetical protein WBL23_15300 [Salinisphaera sp.]|uniref:hypothetical protein n=1 Tax=Salinisphaera sp. TaxID=1914330 RepID=UPI003C7BD936
MPRSRSPICAIRWTPTTRWKKHARPGHAGIEAARFSGTFGPAVSGGRIDLAYPDGHRELAKPSVHDQTVSNSR